MADYCRLRQICLVTADLPRTIADMQAIFGVKLAYQDPHVRRYGLQNALFPFGLAFVEIVSPMQPDTAAGRFLERSGGVGGYMAIFNCSDPQRRGRHANALGVRTAHTIEHHGFHAVQLHPRDCRATMIEFDRTDGEEDLRGPYGPAGGTGWTDAMRTDVTQAARRDRRRKLRSRRPWPPLVAHPGDAVRYRRRRRPYRSRHDRNPVRAQRRRAGNFAHAGDRGRRSAAASKSARLSTAIRSRTPASNSAACVFS